MITVKEYYKISQDFIPDLNSSDFTAEVSCYLDEDFDEYFVKTIFILDSETPGEIIVPPYLTLESVEGYLQMSYPRTRIRKTGNILN